MPPHPAIEMRNIEQALKGLRSSIRAFLLVRRGGLIAACFFAVALTLGLLDYWLRLPTGLRVFCWIVGVGALLWALWRFIRPAVGFRPDLAQLALRVEQTQAGKDAGLEGVLASAVELSHFSETRSEFSDFRKQLAGTNIPQSAPASPTQRALAAASVEQALEKFTNAKFSIPHLLHGMGLRKPILAMTLVTIIMASLAFSRPHLLRVGAQRVLAPWTHATWPLRTGVVPFESPVAHAYGSSFPLRALLTKSDRAADATQVSAHYRVIIDGSAENWRKVVLTPQGKQASVDPGLGAPPISGAFFERLIDTAGLVPGEPAARRLQKIELEYFFTSRDDATDPSRVLLLEPPGIESATALITPPAYITALPFATPGIASGAIDAGTGLDAKSTIGPILAGSRVELRCKVQGNVPIPSLQSGASDTSPDAAAARAAWARGVFPGLADAGGLSAALASNSDWTISFTASKPMRTGVVLTDRFGLSTRDELAFRFEVIDDRAPTASVVDPPQDEGVLPTAVIPAAGEGRDDVALVRVELRAVAAKPENDSPGAGLRPVGDAAVLASNAPTADAQGNQGTKVENAASREAVRTLRAAAELDLATLTLSAGDEVWLTSHATDAKAAALASDASGAASGAVASSIRRLRVLSESELVEQVRGELRTIRDAARALEGEQAKLMTLRDQLAQAAESQLADRNATKEQRAATAQSARAQAQAQSAIARRVGPIGETLERLASRVERNRMGDQTLQGLLDDAQQAASAAKQSAEQAAENLARAERGAQQAAEANDPASQQALQAGQELAKASGEAQSPQSQTSQELTNLAEMLDQNQDEWAVRRELEKLLSEQKQTRQQTQSASGTTAGKAASELTPQEREDMERLARKQDDLARRTEQAIDKLQERSKQMKATDPALAQAMEKAAQRARDRQAADHQRQAGQQLRQNQTGKAQQLQQQAEQALQQALDDLDDVQQERDERLARVLADVVEALQLLVSQQEAELASLGKALAAANTDIAKLALDRGMIRVNQNTLGLSERVKKETQNQDAILSALAAASDAQGASVVALRAQNADLSEADELERVSLARLKDALAEAQKEQDKAGKRDEDRKKRELRRAYVELLEEQVALRALSEELAKQEDNRKTRSTARQLGVKQGELRAKVGELSRTTEEISQAKMFEYAHERLTAAMQRAEGALANAKPGPAVLRDQASAVAVLQGLADALKEDKNKDDGLQDGGGGGGGGGGGQGGQQKLIPPIAELKLLRGMQVEAMTRTRFLEAAAPEDASAAGELQEVGALQQQLAEQGTKLLESLKQKAPEPTMDEPMTPAPPGPPAPPIKPSGEVK